MTELQFGSFAHTCGHDVDLFPTPAEAVAASGLSGSDECSIYRYVKSDGEVSWGIREGHDGWGVHATADDASDAQNWFEDDWSYTD
ncbi:MAG: hypothetical protein HGA71_08215 [Azonexaceae bacterium]|nr:hypothetical protein [Azonexaceae bacterium]